MALAVILWLAKNADSESVAVKAIMNGGVIMCIVGLFAAINDIVFNGPNALIWVAVALYVIFGLWFGMLLLKR